MKLSVGIDIENISKFKNRKTLVNFLFSEKEKNQCRQKKEAFIAYAGKFCAKEAVLKLFKGKIDIRKIEILDTKSGEPEVYIGGKKRDDIQCSISHTEDLATAVAICL